MKKYYKTTLSIIFTVIFFGFIDKNNSNYTKIFNSMTQAQSNKKINVVLVIEKLKNSVLNKSILVIFTSFVVEKNLCKSKISLEKLNNSKKLAIKIFESQNEVCLLSLNTNLGLFILEIDIKNISNIFKNCIDIELENFSNGLIDAKYFNADKNTFDMGRFYQYFTFYVKYETLIENINFQNKAISFRYFYSNKFFYELDFKNLSQNLPKKMTKNSMFSVLFLTSPLNDNLYQAKFILIEKYLVFRINNIECSEEIKWSTGFL